MEGQDQLAELLLGRDNLFLTFVRDLAVEDDVLYAVEEVLFRLFHVHDFLQLVVGLGLQLLGLIGEERLVTL